MVVEGARRIGADARLTLSRAHNTRGCGLSVYVWAAQMFDGRCSSPLSVYALSCWGPIAASISVRSEIVGVCVDKER